MPTKEVRSYGVKDIIDVMRRSRLRLGGHVRMRDDNRVLRRASEMEMEGVRLRGRPKKTWKRCVEEDMREMNIREETVDNPEEWERLLDRPTM